MIFTPPRYQWEAVTVREALEHLDAAEKLIDAHMTSLGTGDEYRRGAERQAPIRLRIELDLAPLVERINNRNTVEATESP